MTRDRAIRIAAFAALVAVMFLLSVHTLTSVYQDIGRHITLGGIIWDTGSVPNTNLFSYTNPDFSFINHHWLAEVLLYWGDQLVGLRGLIFVKALLITAAFGLALAAAWKRRLALPGLTVGLIAALIMIERTDMRPEVLSFLFLGWYLFVLYRKPDSRLLWTLPLVQLLWVNSHIYFFMGPFLWVAFLVGIVIRDGRSALTRRHLLITLAIAAATLLNPNGLTGALYPLQVFDSYGYSVLENKSPFFLKVWGYPQFTSTALYVGIALAAISFIANARAFRRNVFGFLITLATAILALVMLRNFPLFALCMIPAVIRNIDEAGWRWRSKAAVAGGLVVLSLFGASIVTGQFFAQANLRREFGPVVPSGPRESVAFYRSAGIRGPVFNNFDVGSFLIWQLPEEPVFIDGRPEAYPVDFIQDVYIGMQENEQVWTEQVDRYRINAIFWNEYDITPWSRTFVARILKDQDWVLVYRGQGIFILVRDVPENADIIQQYHVQ